MALGAGLLAWALTALTVVPLDRRAVGQRFGAPAGVLHPGLHARLPWPFGATRLVEYGAVHDIGLAPDQAPGAIPLVTAGEPNGRQGIQPISATLRVLYRTGMTDAEARQAAYATDQPEDLVRALAGRMATRYFAARTLAAVLGADRQAMADALRTRLQAALDQQDTGLQVLAVTIGAMAPPSAAVDAWDHARAAGIAAGASVAVAHGAAAAITAQARQAAYDVTSAAQAGAAENIARAGAGLVRFTADRAAARAGGPSFLLERYFTALRMALTRAPKIIIDHRLNWPEAPVLDLRPYSAATGAGTGKEE